MRASASASPFCHEFHERDRTDAAAKDFVVRFYEHWLGQGGGRSDPAAALRATKLEYIKSENPARRDPKVWSPWVLVGG